MFVILFYYSAHLTLVGVIMFRQQWSGDGDFIVMFWIDVG